jgi:hypothetical protein
MRLSAPGRLLLAVVVTVTLSAFMAGGCGTSPGGEKPSAGADWVSSVEEADGVSVTLRSEPRVVKPGGTFSMTLNVRNLSGDSREFTLPSTQTHEFTSFASDGSEVWRLSKGMTFAQAVTPMKMAAGDSQVFEAAWNTEGVSAGEYSVQGYFLGMESLRPTVTVRIEP